MNEVGGYIELEHFNRPMLHEKGIKLNCGRNALAYLIEARGIRKIAFPKFMCDSCDLILQKYGVAVRYYQIGLDFRPDAFACEEDEWLYLVNFYGQLSNEYIGEMRKKHDRLIVDHAQAYFQMPVDGVDTLYTCRKFFGVADGAILYTDAAFTRALEWDKSYERMHFLLGRFECTASEFYAEYVMNNQIFAHEPIKYMSKLTENLLRAVDYDAVKNRRTENFAYLHERLGESNCLALTVPEGAFMYPLYLENGAAVRRAMQALKIYIPTLWPAVFEKCSEKELPYCMAENILPLPCDQRYQVVQMEQILQSLRYCQKNL